jgi:hypothetical protein
MIGYPDVNPPIELEWESPRTSSLRLVVRDGVQRAV